MKKFYGSIAIGTALCLSLAFAPFLASAAPGNGNGNNGNESNRGKSANVAAAASVDLNSNSNSNSHRESDRDNNSDRDNKNKHDDSNDDSTSDCKAFGHLIAPGYQKKNGTTTVGVDCVLPPGIVNKINGGGTTTLHHHPTTTPPGTTTPTNLAPVINSVTGSTTVTEDQMNTWTINATDPESGPLIYRTSFGDSVWGNMFWFWQPYVSTSTFTHTYANPGTYTARFSVKDDHGHSTTTQIMITVLASSTGTTTATTTLGVSGVNAILGTTTLGINWTTNVAADSQVYYSTSSPVTIGATGTASVVNSALVTNHSVNLTGLNATTTYYFMVRSTDASANSTTSSQFGVTTQ